MKTTLSRKLITRKENYEVVVVKFPKMLGGGVETSLKVGDDFFFILKGDFTKAYKRTWNLESVFNVFLANAKQATFSSDTVNSILFKKDDDIDTARKLLDIASRHGIASKVRS